MAKYLFILSMILTGYSLKAQTPRFAKYPVSDTKAQIYLPGEPSWDLSYSEDSSKVYMTIVNHANHDYGAIVVQFAEGIGTDQVESEDLLMSYIRFLSQNVFNFSETIDFGTGHRLESAPQAYGVITYARDADENEFAIKGWIDNNTLAVLFIKHRDELNYNVQEMYLNGFRFPDEK